MSLYGALFAGVSGLSAQSSAMGAIADNVSNVNTIGYKRTSINFKTLVTHQVSLTQYSPGGVQSKPRINADVQGLLQATTSATDMGVDGQGFFITSAQARHQSGFGYSRAGSFKVDRDGFLQNVGGQYLQGWPLENWDGTASSSTVTVDGNMFMKSYSNAAGETYYINDNAVDAINLRPLNLKTLGGTARATSTMAMGANLPALAKIGATEKSNTLIFDSLGNSHNLNYTWIKRDANSWDYEATPPAGSTYLALDDQTDARNTYFSAGRIDFTAIPRPGENMTMKIDGQDMTFNFIDSDDTNNGFYQQAGNNASTVSATATAGDTIDIGGVTFKVTSGATASDTDIDISGATTADEIAQLVAQRAETYFDSRYGAGNWVKTDGAKIQSSLTITNVTGTTFGAPTNDDTINDNATNQPAGNTFNINVAGKSLSQVLDQLSAQVNTAFGVKMNEGVPKMPPSPPGGLAARVPGENAVWFRQFSVNNEIAVNTANLTGPTSDPAVMQNKGYAVPPLSAGIAWTNTDVSKNYVMKFNGDGTIDRIYGNDETDANNPRVQARIGWANGALDMDGGTSSAGGSPAISQFLGNYNRADGLQQLSGPYQQNYLAQNGNQFGNFSGLSISANGIVTASFDNGVTTPIFMIPIATFVNPNGLDNNSGNFSTETTRSGLPTVREAGSGGSGAIASSALESSTVDLGTEFTQMITTQRAYSAASRIITTSDAMLDELLRIKR